MILTHHNIITKSAQKQNITTRCVIRECGEQCAMNTLARGRQKCFAGFTKCPTFRSFNQPTLRLLQDAWIWRECHSWLGRWSETTQRFLANMDHTGGRRWITKLNLIVTYWNIILNVLCAGTCTGNEGSIEECHEPGLWEHYDACKHTEDVVLSCTVSRMKLSVRQKSCMV